MTITIRRAEVDDAGHVARAVDHLLAELFDQAPSGTVREQAARNLLGRPETFLAFLAWDDDRSVGALTLSVCHSLYVNGAFGQIAEFQVDPAYRSRKVGAMLLNAAIAYARGQGWGLLDVNTPPADTWPRTLAFYKSHGFTDNGPFLSLRFD